MIIPHSSVGIVQPVFLLREPIRLIGSRLRDQIDFKAGLAEDLERVQSFGNEKTYERR